MAKEYLELTRLIERLHRRFLDVLRSELGLIGVKDINGVQALLLANVGDSEIVIRDLIERGYYQGSNVSYNIKKLSELGYLEQERSAHDKRSVTIRLTGKAKGVVARIKEFEEQTAGKLDEHGLGAEKIGEVLDALRRLERIWSDTIQYGSG